MAGHFLVRMQRSLDAFLMEMLRGNIAQDAFLFLSAVGAAAHGTLLLKMAFRLSTRISPQITRKIKVHHG